MEDLGKEVDEYFAKKHPLKTKKILCHQCGGAVDNGQQQPHAKICQDIVEDQLDYLIRNGLCFKDGEKDSVRDSLYKIIVGKLSA